MTADTYPDLSELCICGEMLQEEDQFCCQDCEQDFYEVQFNMHMMNSFHGVAA